MHLNTSNVDPLFPPIGLIYDRNGSLFSVCCMAFSSHFQVLSDENGVTCT
jgi:hypothetical protein